MNDKAEEIGATHTYYMNPTGIHHPSMKTTAEDTAKIAAYACSYETITEITSMEVLVIEPTNLRGRRTIYNKNYYFATNMQYKYIWSVPRGLNAGYTEAEKGTICAWCHGREVYIFVHRGGVDAEMGSR